MDNQPVVSPNQPPLESQGFGQAPQPGTQPKKSRRKLFVLLAIIVIVVIVGIVIALSHAGTTKTGDTKDSGTHTAVYANDLKVGDNRAVNACNVFPLSMKDKYYGSEPTMQYTQETYLDRDLPNNVISDTGGLGQVSSCYRPVGHDADTTGHIFISFDGYRNTESAQKNLANVLESLSDSSSQAAVAGLNAKLITIDSSEKDIVGVEGNYIYRLNFTVPDNADTVKLTTIAKAIVSNISNKSVSTRPASVDYGLTFAGQKLTDACAMLDATTYKTNVLNSQKDITDEFAYARTPSPIVSRSYEQGGSQVPGLGLRLGAGECKRASGIKPYIADDASAHEALQDASRTLVQPSNSIDVTYDYFDTAQDAHDQTVKDANDLQPVSGIGDQAYFGAAGVNGELTQLIVQKGSKVMTILLSTSGGDCKQSGSCGSDVNAYKPVAQALVAKLQ